MPAGCHSADLRLRASMPRRSKPSPLTKPRKRIGSLPAEMSVPEAVSAILRQRLDGVLYYLPRVAEHADENVEFVHQLRVAARRSTAAIDAYRSLLPRRRSKSLRAELRQLRKALGEARDLDVMRLRPGNEGQHSGSKKLRRVVRMLEARRIAEQSNVVGACVAAEAAQLTRQIEKLLRTIRWRCSSDESTLQSFHATLLRSAVERFFSKTDTASEDHLVLHAARIEAKRLRYTLELVEPVLPRSAGKKPRRLFAELQESLGQISDHAAAAELFDHWADESPAGQKLTELAAAERKQLSKAVTEFHSRWSQSRLQKLRQLLETLAETVESAED